MSIHRTAREAPTPGRPAAGRCRTRSAPVVLFLAVWVHAAWVHAQAPSTQAAGAATQPARPSPPARQRPAATPEGRKRRSRAAPDRPAQAKASPEPATDGGTTRVDLDALLRAFAHMPGLAARFVEEKHIGLLAQPLRSSGRLFFARPGLLLRRVEQPSPSQVLITPNALHVTDADGEQTIDLGARPDIAPFVQSLTWLLSGDRAKLAETYALAFEPTQGASWRLTLTPKRPPLSQLIAQLRVVGRGYAVSEVRVREKSGDETVTRIVEADPNHRFDARERQQLFGAGCAP